MLAILCLFWIGNQLNAPLWYDICLLVMILCKIFSFGMKMYEKGAES